MYLRIFNALKAIPKSACSRHTRTCKKIRACVDNNIVLVASSAADYRGLYQRDAYFEIENTQT